MTGLLLITVYFAFHISLQHFPALHGLKRDSKKRRRKEKKEQKTTSNF